MREVVFGIDNGVTGTISAIAEVPVRKTYFALTPTFSQQDYTKAKKNITRIDRKALKEFVESVLEESKAVPESCIAVLERPLVNPTRFNASVSAVRALEATLSVFEDMGIPYLFVDSKEWQRVLLPHGVMGTPELKKASADIAIRLFPEHSTLIKKHKDGDALLIAEYGRRKGF